jgi:PKD repeat protein
VHAMSGRRPSGRFSPFVHVAVVCAALLALLTQRSGAQAGSQGQWETVSGLMLSNINPVHMALLNNGAVLMVAGSGNVANDTSFESVVWNPVTRSFGQSQTWWWDMFCNGMVVLPDGQVFINGGNLAYDPFKGESRNAVYDPVANTFTDVESMAHGRWYPSTTVLGDGRVMTFSGLDENNATNTTVEIYTPGSGWSQQYPAGWTPPLYPRMHLLTNGKVAYVGPGRPTRTFDPATLSWSAVIANTNATSRSAGTSVLLPLSAADGYRSRVMILGGGSPGGATTEIIDFSATTPQWAYAASMSQPRMQLNATILPNGKVLATGGSTNNEDAATASLNADLYDPATNEFSPAAANVYPRLYHSNALLLPDAKVLLAGGNPQRGTVERHLEIYSPAYLFNADGSFATRPTITSITPAPPAGVGYGATFQVQTPDASSIASVALVRPGAPTHAFDMEQRLVKLSFTAGSGVLNVTTPPNGNIAPPGYYMLFILNSAGTPSVAKFVRLVAGSSNQAPTATITSPASNVTINAGQALSFTGTGTDPDGTIAGYSWTFPGGTPTASTSQNPTVTYSTPGTRTASLTVTDNGGLTSSPATRTITVPDFSLSATPSTQSVTAGNSATYTVTVNPGAGFSANVTLSVTNGLPSGASASFNPASVLTSGSSTMTVTTGASTPPGSYTLTITGDTGVFTRTTTTTLVVSSNQAPTATITDPATNVTINAGQALSFTGNGTDPDGTIAGYSWTFPGGTPSASTSQNPTVTYSTPGTRTASLTVTDNGGLTSSAATRTITVADFTLSDSPSSQSVTAGGSAAYTVTVNPGAGFSGNVALSVTSGLPAGASASFNPASVLTSGSSTMTISTSASTPPGSYTLTITGNTGVFTRTTTTTLVVTAPTVPSSDFSLSVSPASVLIKRGDKTTFTVTITGQPGFNSPVTLTVSGLPRFASSRFSTSTVTGSGTSTLTINTNKNVSVGNSTLTVTGTSGSLVHSQNVTLSIGQ